jgi:hypothetical protein
MTYNEFFLDATYLTNSKCCANQEKTFWHDICSEKPYDIARKFFACNLKREWYNVDIREKKKEKRE